MIKMYSQTKNRMYEFSCCNTCSRYSLILEGLSLVEFTMGVGHLSMWRGISALAQILSTTPLISDTDSLKPFSFMRAHS